MYCVRIGSGNGLSPVRCQGHYRKQCWLTAKWTLRNKLRWNLNQNTKLFCHGNAVCAMVAIFCSRQRGVNFLLLEITVEHSMYFQYKGTVNCQNKPVHRDMFSCLLDKNIKYIPESYAPDAKPYTSTIPLLSEAPLSDTHFRECFFFNFI